MRDRRLNAEESALWARVTATVRALAGREPSAPSHPLPRPSRALRLPAKAGAQDALAFGQSRDVQQPPAQRVSTSLDTNGRGKAPSQSTDTLDGGWDRRLRRGTIAPDRSIDLHGHTLATAQDALDHALERAVADDVRLLLVVTGRPPRPDGEGRRRGLIRASMGDWLGSSRHAGRIAAVRNAHPKHGGAGALYVILRRRRG